MTVFIDSALFNLCGLAHNRFFIMIQTELTNMSWFNCAHKLPHNRCLLNSFLSGLFTRTHVERCAQPKTTTELSEQVLTFMLTLSLNNN